MSRDTLHPNRIAALPRREEHWNWNPNPSILALHKRLHRKYGAASKQICVDCGEKAKDWSLNDGLVYTDNIDDYSPRCRKCHVLHDDRINNRAELVSQGLKKAYREGRR